MVTESPADTAPSAPPPAPVIATDDISSIIISREPSPVAPIIVEEAPAMISQIEVTATPVTTETPVDSSPIDLGNLFGTNTPADISSSEEELPSALEVVSLTPVAETEEEIEEVEEEKAVEESPLINFAPVAIAPEVESYERTSDFIAGSIEKIDMMITRIDAQSLIEEKDRALAMRTYFVEQGSHGSTTPVTAKAEETNSVETTLTELAVQNAVTETVKPAKKAKAKAETEEEVIGLVGI